MTNSEIIKFIDTIKDENKIIAAMVSGSYATGQMKQNSDIDVFCVSKNNEISSRGRLFYDNNEYEYFISPEWKYYDRINTDLQSMRIYSTGIILFDENDVLKKIKETSINKIKNITFDTSNNKKADYSFYIETILKDGIDIFDSQNYLDFNIFIGSHINKMSTIISELNNTLPVYIKYFSEEMDRIDAEYLRMINKLYEACQKDKRQLWINICNYILNTLGNIDIKEYKSVTQLKKSLTPAST